MRRIAIDSNLGRATAEAAWVGTTWAATRMRADRPWTVTHLPTGRALINVIESTLERRPGRAFAIKLARALDDEGLLTRRRTKIPEGEQRWARRRVQAVIRRVAREHYR